jgi:hypothetical protein
VSLVLLLLYPLSMAPARADDVAEFRKTHPFYPLAGRVRIDGHAPDAKNGDLIVMLNGKEARHGKIEECSAICKPDGSFEIAGGHTAGKFVVTFARLTRRKGVDWAEWNGPEGFKNLYNDPDKNARIPEFVIDHRAPGKTDYVFNLKVDGRPPAQPGPNALVHLEFE